LYPSDIEDTVEGFKPQVVMRGTGQMGMMRVKAETKQYFQEKGIELLASCELFNTLSKSKRVLAGLHLTC
jgi:hypothetical protein